MLEKESKNDLKSFLKELNDTVDELKQYCNTLEALAKNMELKKKILDKKPALQARIEPIRRKFAYLLSDE